MSNFGIPSQNPGENIETTKKISEIVETIPLTSEQIEEFKDVTLTLEQTSKLLNGKLTVIELTKLKIEQLKYTTDSEYNNIKLIEQLNKGNLESNKSAESAEDFLTSSMSDISSPNIGSQTKETLSKIKEKTTELGESTMFNTFIEKIKGSFGTFGSFIAGILSFFKGFINFGNTKKIKEKTEKLLNNKELKETQNKLQTVGDEFIIKFNEKTGDSILPKSKESLKTLLNSPNFFTEAELTIIYKNINKGNFQLSDLSGININKYNQINDILFSPEQKEYLKNNIANKAVDAVAKEYNIDLKKFDKNKKEQLRELFINNGIDSDFIKIAETYEKGGFISYGEIFSGVFSTTLKAPLFAFKLIKIIPFTNLAGNIAKGTSELLELSNTDDEKNIILAKLNELSEEQKDIVLGMMMRKGMFIFNIINKLSYSLSRTIAESIIGGKTSSIEGIKAIATDNYKTQSNLLNRLLSALGKTEGLGSDNIGGILRKNIDNLIEAGKKAKRVSKVMDIINEGGNLKGNEDLKKLGIKSTNIKQVKIELSTVIKEFQNDIYKSTHVNGIWKGIKQNKFGLSKNHHLNQIIEAHAKNLTVLGNEWDRALGNNTLGKMNLGKKLSGMSEFIRFNQETRNLEVHANSLSEGAEKIDKLKKVISTSPALIGNVFGTTGIILAINSIGGINEDKNGLEQLIDSSLYLIPTLGPIKVIFSQSGIQKGESFRDNFISTGELAPMIFFLGMDVAFITKELAGSIGSGDWKRGIKNISNYHIQIFKTPLDLSKAIYHSSIGISEYIKAPGKIDFKTKTHEKGVKINKSLGKIKDFTKNRYGLIGIGGLAILWALSDNFIDSSNEKYRKQFTEKGFINEDGTFNLNKASSSMKNEEKEAFLKYFIFPNYKNIDFKINNNILTIISNNDSIQHKETLIYNNLFLLKELGFDTTNESGIIFINNNKPV